MRFWVVCLTLFLCFAKLCAISQVQKIDLPKGYFAFTFQEDQDGKVWLGLSDGNISGDLGVYHNDSLSIKSGNQVIPSGSYTTSLKLPDGSLMFGGNIINSTGKSVLVWVSSMGVDTLQIPYILNSPLINCMSLINKHDIWIGTASGLLINSRGEWKWLTFKNGLPSSFISSIFQDFRGLVWLGTENGIAYFLDGALFRPEVGTRVISSVTSLFGDRRGYVWCGARYSSEGVSVFNGEVWQTFSGRHGLQDNSASIFFQDDQGSLWIGSCYHSSRGGVSVFDGKIWKGYGYPEHLAKPCVDAIATDSQGRIWMGGSLTSRKGKGITVFDGETWQIIINNPTLPAERVIAFFLDSGGNLWVSSLEGLFVISPNFSEF